MNKEYSFHAADVSASVVENGIAVFIFHTGEVIPIYLNTMKVEKGNGWWIMSGKYFFTDQFTGQLSKITLEVEGTKTALVNCSSCLAKLESADFWL